MELNSSNAISISDFHGYIKTTKYLDSSNSYIVNQYYTLLIVATAERCSTKPPQQLHSSPRSAIASSGDRDCIFAHSALPCFVHCFDGEQRVL